jgi:hypothetical protein
MAASYKKITCLATITTAGGGPITSIVEKKTRWPVQCLIDVNSTGGSFSSKARPRKMLEGNYSLNESDQSQPALFCDIPTLPTEIDVLG